ncbi:MAG TPA: AAA family ATPase, partial [Acidobacteriota bacterium]|nr:AAA family ATPase [Acidobacteriota bacterium]
QGRTVNFKNTIIIMTSNIGSEKILAYRGGFDDDAYQRMKETVLEELRRFFRPEFLNRVDETVVFHALSEAHLSEIVEIQLGHLRNRLRDRHIEIELTSEARRHLVRVGYDPAYGARPLKRAIQKLIENKLGILLLDGTVRDGQKVIVDYDQGQDLLTFSTEAAAKTTETEVPAGAV